MHKRFRLLILSLLSIVFALGCGLFTSAGPAAESPDPETPGPGRFLPTILVLETETPTQILQTSEIKNTETLTQIQVQPTALVENGATPIPGWDWFEGDGVGLWLPESFDGGDIEEDLGVIVEKIRSLGPDYEGMADTIENNPSMFVIWAFDSRIGDTGALTSVAVTTERVLSVMTLDMYLDAAVNQLPAQFQVLEREIVSLDQYEAGRLIVEFAGPGALAKEVLYVIKDGSSMWIITYGTSADEFDERLPVFEQSANTFTINP